MSELLAALPPLAALLLLAFVIGARRWLARREARRRAVARHPSRRHPVPGLDVDGEPLSEAELREYTGIMFRSSGNQGKQGAS